MTDKNKNNKQPPEHLLLALMASAGTPMEQTDRLFSTFIMANKKKKELQVTDNAKEIPGLKDKDTVMDARRIASKRLLDNTLNILANPWVNNGLSLLGGGLQVGSGLFISTVTSPSGIGVVAGGVIAVQGAASAGVALGNLVDLAIGVSPSVNNSGVIGLGTSISTLGTSSKQANIIAISADMGVNLLIGGSGTVAASRSIFIKANALTINSHILNTTYGSGKWLPKIKNPSALENTTNILGASSNIADAYK
jgi:hypothetical protein